MATKGHSLTSMVKIAFIEFLNCRIFRIWLRPPKGSVFGHSQKVKCQIGTFEDRTSFDG